MRATVGLEPTMTGVIGGTKQSPGSSPPQIKPELLAPAGDRTCLIAAVENGADAVYFGLQRHNARFRAHNFDGNDLPEVMGLLHRRGVRGYVTLNTLAFTNELAGLEATVRELVVAGVDAVIVQDMGLARLIRAISPGPRDPRLDPDVDHERGGGRAGPGAGLLAGVILARELSLAEIGRIREAIGLASRGLRPRCALRRLFGPVPDQRGARGPIGEPRRVRPGLPHAL